MAVIQYLFHNSDVCPFVTCIFLLAVKEKNVTFKLLFVYCIFVVSKVQIISFHYFQFLHS